MRRELIFDYMLEARRHDIMYFNKQPAEFIDARRPSPGE